MFGLDDYELELNDYTIEEAREDLGRVVSYFKNQDYWEEAMNAFFTYRDLPISVAIDSDAFAIDEMTPVDALPEWMKTEALGIVRKHFIPMAGRCVFPVKDVKGNVAGFVGWDPMTDQKISPKYLDSKNYGYRAKEAMVYGMEKMPEYYTSTEPVIVTEGLMDTLYLRYKGFQALATLGSYLTPYLIVILNRLGRRCVMIPDNDQTGDKYVRQIKRVLPKAIVYQAAMGKDIEGFRKLEDHKYEEALLNELRMVSNPFARTELLIRR